MSMCFSPAHIGTSQKRYVYVCLTCTHWHITEEVCVCVSYLCTLAHHRRGMYIYFSLAHIGTSQKRCVYVLLTCAHWHITILPAIVGICSEAPWSRHIISHIRVTTEISSFCQAVLREVTCLKIPGRYQGTALNVKLQRGTSLPPVNGHCLF